MTELSNVYANDSRNTDSGANRANQIPDLLINQSFLLFLLEKWLISSGEFRGDRYSFAERPYLLAMAEDEFFRQVTQKSAQSGVTELKSAKALHRLISRRGNVMYAFPALQQLRQLVGARIRPAIEHNPYLFRRVSGSMNLEQIQIGENTLYFAGMQNRRQMISKDVSSLFIDELDTAMLEARANSNAGFGNVVYTLEKRLGASQDPYIDYFSTPSYSGMGISAEYAGDDTNPGSDQREWMVRCRFCGKEQIISWDDNVVDRNERNTSIDSYVPDVRRVCSACHEEFSAQDILTGRYVARRPNLSSVCHGYQVSKLMTASPNLNQMMLDSRNPMKEQEFRCSDLGIPFEPKGSKLTDEILELARNSGSYFLTQGGTRDITYLGADIGGVIHAVIGQETSDHKIKVMWAGEAKTFNELQDLVNRYNVRFGIIDAQPGVLEQTSFCRANKGRMMASFYSNYLESTKDLFHDKDDIIIHVNRTLAMSMVVQMFFNNNVLLPVDIRSVRDFYKMMKAPIRASREDVNGNMRTFFPPTKVADHYFHAFLYFMLALERRPRTTIFLPRGVHF